MKCCLVVGHRWDDKGAENRTLGLTEFDFNYQLAAKIYDAAKDKKDLKVVIVYRDGSYSKLPAKIELFKPNFVVSMHCNAFNGSTTGCETLYYKDNDIAKQMAQIMQSEICETLPQKDRGIKPKRSEDRGGLLLKESPAPAIIVEPFFIDNTKEKFFQIDDDLDSEDEKDSKK